MVRGKENDESHKLVPSCCNCKMVAITGSSGRRKRRFNGLVLLLLSTLGILLALQIPAVNSDGVGGNAVPGSAGSGSSAAATSVPNGGVIIRHGRSRGRHSSERRSQQQHPGGSSAADNGAVHPNHAEEEENSASKAVIIEGIGHQGASLSSAGHEGTAVVEHTDNDLATIRLETKKKINNRLGTVEEQEMLPYHPHPVRFSHKKAIEAKYKILKLTEKGLTNFKWQQQSPLLHRKHVPEEDTANDVARRRSAVAVNVLNKGGSEDSLIGGKQLSPVRTRLQQPLVVHGAETEPREAHGAMSGSANGANNRPVLLDGLGWDANGRYAVRSTDAKIGEDKDDYNRTPRNNSKALVTHLHSYLFKTMPRKRQQPQMDRDNSQSQFQDRELLSPSGHNTSEEVESERPVGAAVDNGKVNKSIISGVDRRLSAQEEQTAASADEQGDSTNPEGVNNGQENRNQMPGTPSSGVIIGSEPNMAKTWKGTDNRNDNAVTVPEETNGLVTEEQLPSNAREEEKEYVGGERKMHNKSSFNSDNSNLNEPSSNATADKRIYADGVMGQHDGLNGLMSQRQLEPAKRGGLGDNKLGRQQHEEARDMVGMKIEETVQGVGNEIMTTERTWMKTLPEGRAQRNNKSESFADREMNRDVETEVGLEGQTVKAPAGRVNESVPVISGGGGMWEDVTTTATTTSTADDKGRLGNKLNKKEAEDEGTPPPPTKTNHRKNATEWKSEIVGTTLQSSSAPNDPLSEYLGEEEDEEVATNDDGLERMLAEDTFQGNSIDLALDDTVKGDDATRNNRLGLQGGYDKLTRFLQTVEQQHLLGSNCTAGTSLNLGEGVVDRYAQERFRVQAEIAVNRANMLTR